MKKLISLSLLTCTLALNAMEQANDITLTNGDISITIPASAAFQSITIKKMLEGQTDSTLNLHEIDTPTLQFVTGLMKAQDQRLKDTEAKRMPNELFGIVTDELSKAKPKQIAKCIKALYFLDDKSLFDAAASYFVQEVVIKEVVIKNGKNSLSWFTPEIAQILKKEYDHQKQFQLNKIFNQKDEEADLTIPASNLRSLLNPNCFLPRMYDRITSFDLGGPDFIIAKFNHKDTVNSSAVSKDKTKVATGSYCGIVKIWSIDGKLIKTLQAQNTLTKIDFLNDTIVTTDSSSIKIWDFDGKCSAEINNPPGINKFHIAQDKIITYSYRTKKLQFWSSSGKCLATISLEGKKPEYYIKEDKIITFDLSDENIPRKLEAFNLNGNSLGVIQEDASNDYKGPYLLRPSYMENYPAMCLFNNGTESVLFQMKNYWDHIQTELSGLDLQQLMLLNYLHQLIKKNTVVAPAPTRNVARTLPLIIKRNLEKHIVLPK